MANELEPNNTRGNADLLQYNIYTYGRLGTNLDIDWFKISVTSASEITIHFDSPLTQISDSWWAENYEITLWKNFAIVNSNLFQVDGKLIGYVDEPGDYYVTIRSFDDTSGEQYGIKYTTRAGKFFTGYEYNDTFATPQ